MSNQTKTNLAITGVYLALLALYFIPYSLLPSFSVPWVSPFRFITGLLIGGIAYEAIYKEGDLDRPVLSCLAAIITFCLILSVAIAAIIIGPENDGFSLNIASRTISTAVIAAIPFLASVYIAYSRSINEINRINR